MRKQTKVSQKFKNKKQNFNLLAEQKKKRGPSPSVFDDDLFKQPPKEIFNQRVLLDLPKNKMDITDSKSSFAIASKSTNYSNDGKEDDNNFAAKPTGLSETTKSIIAKCLQKKGKRPQLFLPGMKAKPLIQQASLDPFVFKTPTTSKSAEPNKQNEISKSNDEPPKLSATSLAIIESLKQKRKNRFERENSERKELSRSESSFSLRFKYEELITGELPLPPKYKQLLNSFISLEQMINLNKIKAFHKRNSLDNLIKAIESTSHRKFSLKILQQILYVVPHFYIMKYEQKTPEERAISKDDYDLIIEIPRDYKSRQNQKYEPFFDFSTILFPKRSFDYMLTSIPQADSNLRQKIFKDKLYQIVNNHHMQFLEQKNLPLYEALKQKSWHHEFDLDNCPDIPTFNIQEKPQHSQVFQKSIIENDIKSDIMKNAMDLVYNEKDISKEELAKMDAQSKALSKFVSKDFIEKLKLKERVNKISNEINDYNYAIHSKKDNQKLYKEILTSLKTLLVLNENKVTGNELSEMVSNLRNSSSMIRNSFTDSELATTIKKLAENYPNLLKVKMSSALGKYVVVMDVNTQIPDIINLD